MRPIILLSLLLLLPAPVSAVMEFPNLSEPLLVDISPTTVSPGERVTVTVESYMIDLDRSLISWYVDDALIETLRGKKTTTFTAGAPGAETRVRVLVTTDSGDTATFSTSIRPVILNLMWESTSFTPPLYRGRALPSPGTEVVAYADARFFYPDGTPLASGNIVYTWRLNGQTLPGSGSGKSSIRFTVEGLYGEDSLSVEAVSADGSFRGIRSVRFSPTRPLITLYRSAPLLGIDYRNAVLENAELTDAEVTLAAIPYFAKALTPFDRSLSYGWVVGGEPVAPDAVKPYLIILSLSGVDLGEVLLEITLDHAREVLQSVRRLWTIRLAPGAGTTPIDDPFSRSFE